MEAKRPLTWKPRYLDGRVHPQRAETHRHVTMATTSSFMSEQRYMMRKPLFSEEHHSSILKTSRPPQRSEEKPLDVSDREVTKTTQISGSVSLSQSDLEVTKNFDSFLKFSELRESREFKEHTSPLCATSSASGWSPPLSPQLTSTIRHLTNTTGSGLSRKLTVSGLENQGGNRQGKHTCYSGLSKGNSESTHQENYWACAIPRTSPPAFDRRSSSWDPNRAYEALLDYSYPLRPGRGVSESDISGLEGDSYLQDSGIGLDQVDSSISLPGLRCPSSGERSQRSPDLQGVRPSGGQSIPDPVASSLDGLDCSEDRGGRHADPRAWLCFPTSTLFLPQSRCLWGDVDEEFWALPEHLQVLRLPSTQVREATAEVSRPLTGGWECVAPSPSSLPASEAESVGAAEASCQRHEDQARAEQGAAGGGSLIRPRSSPSAVDPRGPGGVEPAAAARTGAGKLEMDAMGQRGEWERRDQSDSLMQHIQVFCSHLKLLIQQLYALSERTQRLSAPPMDLDGVKSALLDYQSFQSEVSSQQPLSDCVLHTGRLLLSCINTASPMLRDTLLLIEHQSGELQSHAQLLLTSILSAMDSILQSRDDGVELLQTS